MSDYEKLPAKYTIDSIINGQAKALWEQAKGSLNALISVLGSGYGLGSMSPGEERALRESGARFGFEHLEDEMRKFVQVVEDNELHVP